MYPERPALLIDSEETKKNAIGEEREKKNSVCIEVLKAF